MKTRRANIYSIKDIKKVIMKSAAEIGNQITKERKRQNLTIKELGRKVGLSESAMWNYENGKVKALDINILSKISTTLGINLKDLLGLDEPQSDQWGDDDANIAYLIKKEPELFKQYIDITRDPNLRILFDKAKDLDPKDVEAILILVNSITNKNNI